MTKRNIELEAAEAEIAKLKAEITRLTQESEDDSALIRNLEVDLHTARANLEQREVDWGREKKHLEDEIRTLKDTVVKMATQGTQVSQPISRPHSPASAASLLGQMIASEEVAQEKEWGK